MAGVRKAFWRAVPLVGLGIALAASALAPMAASSPALGIALPVVGLVVLMGVVFAAVYHADVIAHRTGEPYGTLVLTVAVTVIEVALILSIMLAGAGRPSLARETVFSVIMVVCNGLVGLCLILGGLRYGEQGFRLPGASAYLVVLMPLATLTLILPSYTTSAAGPYYSASQLGFVSLATLALSACSSTSRRCAIATTSCPIWAAPRMTRHAARAAAVLGKRRAAAGRAHRRRAAGQGRRRLDRSGRAAAGAPIEAVGLLVALLVLLPETFAALRAARRNELQKSLNLALGSSLATIGLTIPAVAVLAMILKQPLELGLDMPDTVLLVLTFAVSLVTFGGGRTNILPGFVHLVLFAIFVFLIFVP